MLIFACAMNHMEVVESGRFIVFCGLVVDLGKILDVFNNNA